MDDFPQLPVIAVAALVLFFVAYLVLRYVALALWWLVDTVSDVHAGLRATADGTGYRLREKARKREAARWLNARVATAESAGGVDQNLVRARTQTPVIRTLVGEEVPATIRRCLQVHRIMAMASNVEYMHEIAFEPECRAMRDRVVDLVEFAVATLEKYPLLLDDARLLQNVIVLRKRILPNCRACPYLQHAVDAAPPLCPSAEAVQLQQECKTDECPK